MRMPIAAGLLLASAGLVGCRPAVGAPPVSTTTRLANGLRLTVVHIPGSPHASIFTFVPLGLCSDGPGQTQWSHLVEHLVIRSTVPEGSAEANGETLADHMRLDWYGTTDNWQTGLDHHVRWLSGVRFTEESLETEKQRVLAECDNVARLSQTHKFALAAWWQAHLLGARHVALKGDVRQAKLAEVELHRAAYFARFDRIVVCVVGGLDNATVLAGARARLEGIQAPAAAPPALPRQSGAPETVTWDLQATHLILAWPLRELSLPDRAVMMAACPWLNQRCYEDPVLRANAGQAIADVGVVTPQGTYLCLSAPIAAGGDADTVKARLAEHVYCLSSGGVEVEQVGRLGKQLAEGLTSIPDPAMVARQTPGTDRAMLEGNLGLQWGMTEFRFGERRSELADCLRSLTADEVRRFAARHLTPEAESVCLLVPPAA